MSEKESEMERFSILIPKEDKEKLQEICKKFDTDFSKFIRKLIKKVIISYEFR